MKKIIPFLFFLCFYANAQIVHEHEGQRYYPVDDPKVKDKLGQWQDLKFGLLMHWGAYSQWGIVESWSICPEDYGWCERKKGNAPENYFEYVKEYEALKQLPSEVMVHAFQPKPGSEIKLLGSNTKLTWKNSGGGVLISIPEKLVNNPPSDYAWVFKMNISE